jgi:hypothetical protein
MTTRRLWVPLLVGLLVAALIGPGMVAGAEPRVTVTKALMIPAAAAIPISTYMEYNNVGSQVRIEGSGEGGFTVPLSFPVSVVTIRRITVYAYDNDASHDVGVALRRTYPPDNTEVGLGWVTTSGASTADPQSVTSSAISNRTVSTANYGLFLWIQMAGGSTRLYGVKILYSYEA